MPRMSEERLAEIRRLADGPPTDERGGEDGPECAVCGEAVIVTYGNDWPDGAMCWGCMYTLLDKVRPALADLLTEFYALRAEHAVLVELLREVERGGYGRTFWEGQVLRPIDVAAKMAREVLNANQS